MLAWAAVTSHSAARCASHNGSTASVFCVGSRHHSPRRRWRGPPATCLALRSMRAVTEPIVRDITHMQHPPQPRVGLNGAALPQVVCSVQGSSALGTTCAPLIDGAATGAAAEAGHTTYHPKSVVQTPRAHLGPIGVTSGCIGLRRVTVYAIPPRARQSCSHCAADSTCSTARSWTASPAKS